MTDTYDVIVVGAGPAGSVTALELARRGRRVLLLDRHAFPRDKACGDCLSPEVTRQLESLGLLRSVEAVAPARLDGWRIFAPDGGSFTGTFARAAGADPRVRTALALTRRELDAVLVRAALEAGVDLRTGVRVDDVIWSGGRVVGVLARHDDESRRALVARVVVGADGLRSIVARRVGATARPGGVRKHSFTLHPRLPAGFTGRAGEMHVVPNGCIGIAPVEAGERPSCNLTFVTLSTARRGDPRQVMRAMIDAAPGLRERRAALLASIDADAAPLASGPFDRPVRRVTGDGVALVGDAAGYYDPFTGQGVCHAIAAAMRLAEVVERALQRSGPVLAPALADYAAWVSRTRRPARAVQRVIEYVTARPALMNRLTRSIRSAPGFADVLVGVTGDIAPTHSLMGRPLLDVGVASMRTGPRNTA